jgi:glycosyltransferase involved in cell wall biosynthesis
MKICVLNPGVVHAVPRTLAFARYFDEVHYVDMIGMDSREQMEENGIVYHVPFYNNVNRLGSIRLQKLFRRIAPDGIVCHFALGGHFFNSILYNRCPVAVIAMGNDVLYDEGDGNVPALRRLLVRIGLRRADYISAKSLYIKERLESYHIRTSLDVNYWGADLSVFKPGDKKESRKRLGLPSRVPVILSPRAVEPRLNIHLIVESFITVRNKYPDARLVVLGRTENEYRRKIENFITENGIAQNIDLVYEVGQNALIDYYNASDVIVSVAKSDGIPNTLLEAFSCRRPIVVGKIPHIEELLQDGHNAKLCDNTVHGIADALIDVLQNYSRNNEMVNAGYDTVNRFGDIKANGEKFARAFEEIILRKERKKKALLDFLPFVCIFFTEFAYRGLFRH